MERSIGRGNPSRARKQGGENPKRKLENTFQPDLLHCEARGGSGGGFGRLRLPDSRPGGSLQVDKLFAPLVWFGFLVLVDWFCLLLSCLVWFPCKILFRRADFRKDDGEPMGCRLQLKLGPKGVLNLHIALEEEV